MKNLTAQAPSWTGAGVNKKHGFVIAAYSSSQHEVDVIGAWRSGTEPLETTAVPASGTTFYRKKSASDVNRHTVTYKLTGSQDWAWPSGTLSDGNSYWHFSATDYSSSLGPRCVKAHTDHSYIEFDVTESGKLIDIEVWIELTHLSHSDTGNWNNKVGPLGQVSIVLKSPNVSFRCGNPWYNQGELADFVDIKDTTYFNDAFILWEPAPAGPREYVFYAPKTNSGSWGKDRHMRVVFKDDARPSDHFRTQDVIPTSSIRQYHLHNLYGIYDEPQSVYQNPRHIDLQNEGKLPASGSYRAANAPNNFYGMMGPRQGVTITAREADETYGKPAGNDFPWTSDATITDENTSHQMTGSPPDGWLTAPGGTSSDNEWPTTGINFGPSFMRPVYPMLDAVETLTTYESSSFPVIPGLPITYPLDHLNWKTMRGYRPGLRDSEINGRWRLQFNFCEHEGSYGVNVPDSAKFNLRQVRLKLTYKDEEFDTELSKRDNLFKKNAVVPYENRDVFYAMLSSALYIDWPDIRSGPDATVGGDLIRHAMQRGYVIRVPERGNEYSRTSGFSYLTSSLNSLDFAVFSRITGVLHDTLIARDTSSIDPIHWFVSEEFGTPYIPDSTGSGKPTSPQHLTKEDAATAKGVTDRLLSPDLIIRRGSENVDSLLKDQDAAKSMRDQADDAVNDFYTRSGSA
jgi:hypothetical protein